MSTETLLWSITKLIVLLSNCFRDLPPFTTNYCSSNLFNSICPYESQWDEMQLFITVLLCSPLLINTGASSLNHRSRRISLFSRSLESPRCRRCSHKQTLSAPTLWITLTPIWDPRWTLHLLQEAKTHMSNCTHAQTHRAFDLLLCSGSPLDNSLFSSAHTAAHWFTASPCFELAAGSGSAFQDKVNSQ